MTRAIFVVVMLTLAIVVLGSLAYRAIFAEKANFIGDDPTGSTKTPTTTTTTNPSDPSNPQNAGADGGVLVATPVPTATLTAARGTVQVRHGDDGTWSDAVPGQKLSAEDSVRAGRNAEASVTMGDGVEVRLSPRSELRVRELSEAVARVRLDEGHVTATVDDGRGRILRVQAKGSDAEAESKGGTFGVVTDGRGQLAVATTTGSVKLSARGQTVEVVAGQTSTAANGSGPSAPTAISSSLFLKLGTLAATKTNQTTTTVAGTTTPGTLVRVGDQTTTSDGKGRFSLKVPLRDGKNDLAIEVQDASGRREDKKLPTVLVDREKPGIDANVEWGKPH